MLASEYDAYGSCDVLHVRNVAEPRAPQADEIRIRVAAAGVNPKDTFVRKGRFRALSGDRFPKSPGYDWSGTVDALGASVTTLHAGQRAFGMVNGWEGQTCAQFINVRAAEAAPAPLRAEAHEAAALPLAALTALQALEDVARVRAGQRLYVNGASGGVGLFAIQLARSLGATVTASASAKNEALCRTFGAQEFADYQTRPLEAQRAKFDVVFDVFGNLAFDAIGERLEDQGILVTTVPSAAAFASIAATPSASERRMRLVVVESRAQDLIRLGDMFDRGQLAVHIDAIYALKNVRDAHAHVERKHTRGKVVVALE
ncbi:MAG: NAD(P)-dependent alcohol dehydrogenase [Candidatus Eremiobacteraeota bacterium]|nr:NAD(P)-dependent alcohol dehydrogenase [Candidatus Eremiobacteraeota bacterium]